MLALITRLRELVSVFSAVKLLLFPSFFILHTLEGSHSMQPTSLAICRNYFKFFCMRDLSPLPFINLSFH